MNIIRLGATSASLLLCACATLPPGWPEYRAAIKCHLENKDQECDKAYESAIKKNPRLQGVHASYGSHLYRRGDKTQADEEFKTEIQNHPGAAKSVEVVIGLHQPGVVPAEAPSNPPENPAAAASPPVASPPAAAVPAKPAAAVKENNR